MSVVHLGFTMATASETAAVMRAAGFIDIRTKDRNAWYAETAAQDVAAIEGPLREQIIAVSSQEIYDEWVVIRRQLAAAAQSGSLRPTHLHGMRAA
jgi:cyclopropane fatty-acyl-phospholipid synthase-like methyltransferase